MHLPFEVDSSETGLYFSTLDYIGRPVLTITKSNVYKFYHDYPFQVSYDFQRESILIEPFFPVVFFFVVFLSAVIYARLDFSFKDEKKKL